MLKIKVFNYLVGSRLTLQIFQLRIDVLIIFGGDNFQLLGININVARFLSINLDRGLPFVNRRQAQHINSCQRNCQQNHADRNP